MHVIRRKEKKHHRKLLHLLHLKIVDIKMITSYIACIHSIICQVFHKNPVIGTGLTRSNTTLACSKFELIKNNLISF